MDENEMTRRLCVELEKAFMHEYRAENEHAYTIACLGTEAERRFLLDYARAARGGNERRRATCRALYTAYLVHVEARNAWKEKAEPHDLQREAERTTAAVYEAVTGMKAEGKEYAETFLPWLNEAAPASVGDTFKARQ